MPLTDEEQTALDELLRKQKEPESTPGSNGQSLQVVIDLSDPEAVQRGFDLGFLKKSDLSLIEGAEEDDPPKKGKEGEEEETPAKRRRGYFKEGDE